MNVNTKIFSAVSSGDILFIVPPFVNGRIPITGPHILQCIALEQGYKAEILYLNLLLASEIGYELYDSISYGQPFRMLGERLFARSAYGLSPLGKSPDLCNDPVVSVFGNAEKYPIEDFEYKYYNTAGFDQEKFLKIEQTCYNFVQEAAQAIASLDYKIAALSSNWEQTNCSMALINALKKIQPEMLALIGGSNCEGEMAEGIASLSSSVDYIFSGESEHSFVDFLKAYKAGNLPKQRIIEADPIENLDNIPLPEYDAYFNQLHKFLHDDLPKEIVIAYETSRGCWWGKCSFCGMNGKRVRFRQKAVTKVAEELDMITTRYPENRVFLIDKVIPESYIDDLLPLLSKKNGNTVFSCEHRTSLSLDELIRFKKAGFKIMQFGIEALSDGLLKLVKKGVSTRQNLLLLRNVKALGIFTNWNLLWGFPGDKIRFYEETLELLPLLHHLPPPVVFRHICLDRFSTYFENPEKHGISNLRPWAVYDMTYPDWADTKKLAYRFIGEYPCEAHDNPEIIAEIHRELENWRKSFKKSNLVIMPFADYFTIIDTRDIAGKNKTHILEASQAGEIMTCKKYEETEYQKWAVDCKLGAVVNSWYVPLITASPDLLMEFEK